MFVSGEIVQGNKRETATFEIFLKKRIVANLMYESILGCGNKEVVNYLEQNQH